jgi:hypothetical protein
MAELKQVPVKHDHRAFLAKASKRKGFTEAYASLELEYQVVSVGAGSNMLSFGRFQNADGSEVALA